MNELQGLLPKHTINYSNRINAYSLSQERENRVDTTLEQVNIIRQQLPILLKSMGRIPDVRNPKTTKHKLNTLLLYGIFCFVFQVSSRRDANRKMTTPQFVENLQKMFPELESIPHNDTLKRFLEKIDVADLENMQIRLIKKLIRSKKFKKYLINNCYPIAFDGTQKLTDHQLWSEEWQQRTLKTTDGDKMQYYVYVLEANLVFKNGMSIPLMSEFLEYTKGNADANKQDAETRAFKRLAKRLKKYFPNLRIMALMDGLYANGPIIEACNDLNWQYMIVLKDNCLPSVWEEAEGLSKLQNKNNLQQSQADRMQNFNWVNNIEYCYETNSQKKITKLHVVICHETWRETDENNKIITKTAKHAWLSSRELSKYNVHERCNFGARFRWGIEESMLKEKRQGYQYEHCFSKNWNAMKGYHYLMRIAHLLNELVLHAESLKEKVIEKTQRGFIAFVFETCRGPWFDPGEIKEKINENYRYSLA